MAAGLIEPYGGKSIDLFVGPRRAATLRADSKTWPSWDLAPTQLADLELLLGGGLSPLRGFMGRAEVESVGASSRLLDGTFWPVPVVLEVGEVLAKAARPGTTVALRDAEGVMLAALEVQEVWGESKPCLAGRVEGLQLPVHHDFADLRKAPAETRRELETAGWSRVVACQGRGPIHRDDVRAIEAACRERGARLLLQPAVGAREPGDPDHYARVRCLGAARAALPADLARLVLLPLAPRGGEREVLLRAIVARNSGCDHLSLNPSLAGAADLLERHRAEIGVAPLVVDATGRRLAESELGRLLEGGRPFPDGFTFPEVERELRRLRPPLSRSGFTVFFTGCGRDRPKGRSLPQPKLPGMRGRTPAGWPPTTLWPPRRPSARWIILTQASCGLSALRFQTLIASSRFPPLGPAPPQAPHRR